MRLRKGAFFAEKAVWPTYMKFMHGSVSPAFDTIELLPLLIF